MPPDPSLTVRALKQQELHHGKTIHQVRNYYINLDAVACVETTEDGGMAITVLNRDQPIRLGPKEGAEFGQILGRFSLQLRSEE